MAHLVRVRRYSSRLITGDGRSARADSSAETARISTRPIVTWIADSPVDVRGAEEWVDERGPEECGGAMIPAMAGACRMPRTGGGARFSDAETLLPSSAAIPTEIDASDRRAGIRPLSRRTSARGLPICSTASFG